MMDKPPTELHGPLKIHDPFSSTISDDFLTFYIAIVDEILDTDMACCHKILYSEESTLHLMGTTNTTYINR